MVRPWPRVPITNHHHVEGAARWPTHRISVCATASRLLTVFDSSFSNLPRRSCVPNTHHHRPKDHQRIANGATVPLCEHSGAQQGSGHTAHAPEQLLSFLERHAGSDPPGWSLPYPLLRSSGSLPCGRFRRAPTITLQRRRRDCRIIAPLVTGLVTHHASLVAVFGAFSQQSRNILGALSKHLRIALGALSEYARSCLELPRRIPGAAREWTSERAGAWVSESVSGVGE